jgi:hypothetical protein
VKNLEELLDVTVTDAVRDGLGVTRGTIAGLRDDKGEDVLNKDVVGCDSVVDLDTFFCARAAG